MPMSVENEPLAPQVCDAITPGLVPESGPSSEAGPACGWTIAGDLRVRLRAAREAQHRRGSVGDFMESPGATSRPACSAILPAAAHPCGRRASSGACERTSGMVADADVLGLA